MDMEDSLLEVDGPPSSPFMSQIAETNSRASSKQYSLNESPLHEDQDDSTTGARAISDSTEKENIHPSAKSPVSDNKMAASPNSKAVLEHITMTSRAMDIDLMPPPSLRTVKSSSHKPAAQSSPLSSRSIVNGASPSFKTHARPTVNGASPSFKTHSESRNALESTNVDDTCFSTFSELQDFTWTRSPRSPTKLADISNEQSPTRRQLGQSRKRWSSSRSPSPTPRRLRQPQQPSSSSPSCLIDFTEQLENVARPKGLPSSRTEPNLLQHLQKQRSPVRSTTRASLATPAKPNSILDLLDFELPPAPTPRSVPTITVRELETLKSQYLSQISSLNATLNGREAEVESLKRAVGDAERRAGEAQEAVREEKIRREQAEQEKVDWERRGLEVENVLRTVKEEIMKAESEKEELVSRAEACEKRADAAEARAFSAEEKIAVANAIDATGFSNVTEQVQGLVASQIDAKIEAVSRELHAVYKDKHERKVATLKQSYEARTQKRTAELQTKVDKLERANDELLVAKAALVPLPSGEDGDASLQAQLKTQLEEHKAHLARLEQELSTSKVQHEELVHALERERIEKGDLVAAVDEMLALQAEQGPAQGAMSVVEDFRKSISRPPSSMRHRAGPESKIGRIAQVSRTPAGKSEMLANIERMGRANARD